MTSPKRRQWYAVLGVIAVIGVIGSLSLGSVSWGAEKKQSAKPTKASKSASGQKMLSGGTVQVESTKASGASIVAESRACGAISPKIDKVKPDEGRAGDKVTITGENFGSPGCLATISFGPGSSAQFTQSGDNSVTATVPKEARRGIKLLIVTTTAGEDSKPFLVK